MGDKKTYRIGKVARRLNLDAHVLRFWEKEFPQIVPLRSDKGQRLYTENQMAILRRIKYLLHERGMTIDGAKRILEGDAGTDENGSESIVLMSDPEFMNMLVNELDDICKLLSNSDRK